MAVLPILEVPHPILRQKAKKVRRIDASTQRLIDDMIDTMHYASGVGLAANQVGALQRVMVIHLPDEEDPRAYINPEITHRFGEQEVEEGCLSVPGYRGLIMRAVEVKAKGQDRQGRLVRGKAQGLRAQALEHEVDHLNGILYIDHLKSHENLWKLEPHELGTEGEVAIR